MTTNGMTPEQIAAAVADMEPLGRIGYVTKGDYDSAAEYKEMDVVLFESSLWTPKRSTTGNPPPSQPEDESAEPVTENGYWRLFLPGIQARSYVKKTDISAAPTGTEPGRPGICYPDGKTIKQNEDGMLTGAPTAKVLTESELKALLPTGELEGMTVFVTVKNT